MPLPICLPHEVVLSNCEPSWVTMSQTCLHCSGLLNHGTGLVCHNPQPFCLVESLNTSLATLAHHPFQILLGEPEARAD